jgi:lipoprotein-anchoring transpeptidase ErfK/SrfK
VKRSLLLLVAVAAASAARAQTPPPTPPAATPPAPPTDEKKPAKAPPKPLVALVLPATKKVLGYEKVKPYTSPDYEAEPPLEPSETKVVEIVDKENQEVLVLVRPWVSPLIGSVPPGTRLSVKGVVHPKSGHGCPTHLWFAVEPWGYVCSKNARPTAEAATTTQVLQVPDGERLPFHYVMMGVKEGDKVPFWANLDDAKNQAEPERYLERGDTVAIAKNIKIDGVPHYVSVEGKVMPVKGSYPLQGGSEWQGEALDDKTVFPFGWVTAEAKVYDEPSTKKRTTETMPRRTRVTILEEQGEGGRRMLRVADGKWVRAADVNEVRKIPRPDGITAAKQWIDVDLGEQILVAYEEDKPVYATLTSSGRAIPTPRGNYPIWAKATSISMKSQPYEDKAYFVNKVPWVLFFQAHNAIHGAYWHDRFGVTKSHGCVNVSPLDARHLFEWALPPLPAGWSGYRSPDLLASATVHVRNSHLKKELIQERPIGPPDKDLEAQKMEEAEERRAAAPAPTPTTAPEGMKP